MILICFQCGLIFDILVLLARQAISADDRRGVNLLLHQFVCAFKQLCSKNHLHSRNEKKKFALSTF